MSEQQIIEIMAASDAAFDKRGNLSTLSRSDRERYSARSAAAIAALKDAGFVIAPLKLLSEAHACMLETGWHDATSHQRSGDGVIEAAVSDIERRFAEIADFTGKEP
jgi:hypothetical protein